MGMNEFRVQGASITRMKFPFPSSKQAFGHNYHSYYSRHNEPTPNNAPWAWMDSGWTENTFPLSSNPLVNHSVSWNSTDGWMDKHHQERRCSKFLPLFQLDIFLRLEGEILVKWVIGFKRYLCVFLKLYFSFKKKKSICCFIFFCSFALLFLSAWWVLFLYCTKD